MVRSPFNFIFVNWAYSHNLFRYSKENRTHYSFVGTHTYTRTKKWYLLFHCLRLILKSKWNLLNSFPEKIIFWSNTIKKQSTCIRFIENPTNARWNNHKIESGIWHVLFIISNRNFVHSIYRLLLKGTEKEKKKIKWNYFQEVLFSLSNVQRTFPAECS